METHARLLIAPSLETAPIDDRLKHEGADVRHLLTAILGIDDARRLIGDSSRRPVSGDSHHFVIVAKSITLEAQNALLKLFEDPPPDTVFHLVVPHESVLISTLRSRLIKEGESVRVQGGSAADFLGQSIKDQLEEIASLSKNAPERLGELAKELALSPTISDRRDLKRSLLQTLGYVYNRGASRKMLMEELVLTLHAKDNR